MYIVFIKFYLSNFMDFRQNCVLYLTVTHEGRVTYVVTQLAELSLSGILQAKLES